MRIGQGVRTALGHGGITCALQTQFSSFFCRKKYEEILFSYLLSKNKIDFMCTRRLKKNPGLKVVFKLTML